MFRSHYLAAVLVGSVGMLTLGAFGTLLSGQAAPKAPPPSGRRAASRSPAAPVGRPIRVLFLGMDEERPHNPAKMFPYLAAPLARLGIQLTYVATPAEALDVKRLGYYDALMIYGNQIELSPAQETALLGFVEGGKGLIALHSASAMFTGSEKYISLVGAQFQRHGTGDFTAQIVEPTHEVMRGIQPFETWDETYVHIKHNPVNRTVLMERIDAQGREPWTWVRTQGQGRVFYTAYGHDERTWNKPQFQKLIENAVVWAVDAPTREAFRRLDMPGVTYLEGFNVPNYENRTPAPQYQMGFEPDQAQQFIQTPAEFEVKLFASEPLVTKPIAMTFDERGRLWVIESNDYPNVVSNGIGGNDKIKILEDTDGDGRADKVTVFADHLNVATGLTFANGGVVVAAAPHMLFLKDTNGDDKADVREILSTGWGVRDTHAVASNLQYGPDNYVWGTVGYSGFNGTMNGKPMQFTQGAYRFKPDGSGFEYMVQSTNNTWGLGFNEAFDVFGSTANGDPSWYMAIPNRYFENLRGLPGPQLGRGASPGYQSLAQFTTVHYTTPYVRQVDNHGFYTAATGHMFYTARAYPQEYWNRIALVNEPTAHLTGQVIIEPRGAGYVARDGWNLMSSAEEWFAPVATMIGPDGAVWIDDWYNFVVQHSPTPAGYGAGKGGAYETSMRDHTRGRIYRVTYKGAPAAKKRSLSKNDVPGLLEALGCDNMSWRLHAQRLLVERRQKDVVPQLIAMVRSTAVDAIGLNGGALHALWTLKGLGELDATTTEAYRAAIQALKHPAAAVRKAAAQVLPKTSASARSLLDASLLQDPELHTRLAATLALADMPPMPESAQAVFQESQKPDNYGDPWLGRAFYIAATRQQSDFLAAYNADPKRLPFSALSVPLRMGNATPDWRSPSTADLDSSWKTMQLPGNWKSRGLPDFDGLVWFTRTVDVPQGAAVDSVSFGPVRSNARVWVNGIELTPPAYGGYLGGAFGVPKGAIKPGANTITAQVTNQRGEGGFVGMAADMYMKSGEQRIPLAGLWKYRVERSRRVERIYDQPGELAAHVAFVAGGRVSGGAGATLPAVVAAPDVVIQLSVVPNEMKYATTELTVQPGQLVQVVFTNPDQMQHNFVLGAPGTLQAIGAAADQFTQTPGAAAQDYVPDIAQVLFKAKMVEAGQSVTFQFRAPAAPGQYPYVCTYPGHWRLMNGVLNVVAPGGGDEARIDERTFAVGIHVVR